MAGKSKITKATFFAAFLTLILFLVFGNWAEGHERIESIETPSPSTSRTATSSTLDLAEVWRVRTGVPNPNPEVQNPPFLFLTNGKVIVSTFVNETQNFDAFLTAYAMDSGRMLWQTRFANPDFGTGIGSAYLDDGSNKLFLEYSFRVSAFDTTTGSQLWITDSLGGHTGYTFPLDQPEGTLLLVSSYRERISIDPATGQVLSRQTIDEPWMSISHGDIRMSLLSKDDIENLYLDISTTACFAALDANDQLIWQLPYFPEFWPTFVNEDDFLVEFGGPFYWIWRIDTHTGIDRWRSSMDIVSNYTVSGDRVFSLREDGYLLSMDLETGTLLGYMVYEPAFTEAVGRRSFWVAASDSYLFVYFGDTQELITYHW